MHLVNRWSGTRLDRLHKRALFDDRGDRPVASAPDDQLNNWEAALEYAVERSDY
jgi:hypothetical protein